MSHLTRGVSRYEGLFLVADVRVSRGGKVALGDIYLTLEQRHAPHDQVTERREVAILKTVATI
jgi:hypothetical protein